MDAIAKKEWFTDWLDSPYYHLLYGERKEKEKDAFIDNLIQYLHPRPGAALLDGACGRGSHAGWLADRGFEVTGIDLSEKNIKAARRLENDHLDFFCHDMRMPFRVNYYDVAFNLFDRFGYFASRRENGNVLRSVSGAIRKNGFLVMDYLNSSFVKEHLTAHEVKVVEGVEFDIHREYKEGYFLKNIHISDVIHMRELSFTEKAAAFTLEDFREMFARQRLEIVDLFGNYHLNPYEPGLSPRLILIAKKI